MEKARIAEEEAKAREEREAIYWMQRAFLAPPAPAFTYRVHWVNELGPRVRDCNSVDEATLFSQLVGGRIERVKREGA
jgi:hypothetical protein